MKTATPTARSARRSAGLQSIFNLILFLGILLMINYLGFKYYSHKDLSFSQFYTLSPKTDEALKKLDAPLTIYTFLDPKNPLEAEQIDNLLKEYQRVGGKNIDVEKIDPAYDPARAAALQSKLHFDGNDFLIIFEYKDHAPLFVKQSDLYEMNPMTGQIGAFKGEQQLTSTLLKVVEGKAARVYFTEGHGEHPLQDSTTPAGYGFIGASLKGDNIDANNINLAQKGEVPADADAVVIAGPSIQFSPIEIQALDKYLSGNGKLFILIDPYVAATGLNDLLAKYGMTYADDLVLYRSGNIVSTTGALTTLPLAFIYQGGFSTHPITAKFAQSNLQLLIQSARSIDLGTGDKANPKTQFLLQTDADAWGWVSKEGAMPTDPKQLTFNKATDIPGPVTVAAAYDAGSSSDPKTNAIVTGTRVIAIGTSKFVENDVYDGAVAANFFSNCLDWLVKKDAILDIAPKKPQEYGVSLSPMSFRTVIWCAIFFIPGAALILGIFTWLSRRK